LKIIKLQEKAQPKELSKLLGIFSSGIFNHFLLTNWHN